MYDIKLWVENLQIIKNIFYTLKSSGFEGWGFKCQHHQPATVGPLMLSAPGGIALPTLTSDPYVLTRWNIPRKQVHCAVMYV